MTVPSLQFQCCNHKELGIWSLNAEEAHSCEVCVHVCMSVTELIHLAGSMHCQLCTILSLCPSGTSLSQDQSSWGPHSSPRLLPTSISQHLSLYFIFCTLRLRLYFHASWSLFTWPWYPTFRAEKYSDILSTSWYETKYHLKFVNRDVACLFLVLKAALQESGGIFWTCQIVFSCLPLPS